MIAPTFSPNIVKFNREAPISTVGVNSSVPYGPTNGYAASVNGVSGFVGPAASSLRQPISWYIRAGGSNDNGGSSNTTAAERTGTDGVANNSTTFTSATAAFTSADVNKGICIGTGATAKRYRIASVTNATTIILDRINSTNTGSLTWAIGGACADPRALLADTNVNGDNNSPVRTGDTIYIGAGTYRCVLGIQATWIHSANGYINIIGDVSGRYTGDSGMVQWTSFTTNDKTAPPATTLLSIAAHSGFYFSNIFFVGSKSISPTLITMSSAQNITFVDCAFTWGNGSNSTIFNINNTTAPGPNNLNILLDRCELFTTTLAITLLTNSTADYDANITIRNCRIIGTNNVPIDVTASGALIGKGGGIKIRNCLIFGGTPAMRTNSANNSSTFPCQVYNSHIFSSGSSTGLSANTLGQIIEDYNIIFAGTPRGSVAIGAHSVSDGSYAPLFHFGQERIWGGTPRKFGEPMIGSPLLAFGANDVQTGIDLYTGPRPSGGSSPLQAVGPLERSNVFAKETGTVNTGSNAISNTGPGYQDYDIEVDANSQTFSIYVNRDSSYVGPLPSMTVLANDEIGVSSATVSQVGASGSFEQITLPAFTPTAAGIVTIRLLSSDMSGVSKVVFDTFAVS